jgi:HSP20 family protein
MLLTRWNPDQASPFAVLGRELEQIFDGFFDAPTGARGRHVTPPLSIAETDDGFVVEVEVPGVTADDLDVSVHGTVVTLKGERKVAEVEGQKPLRREWGAYSFERSFELPADIDADRLEAELKNGILHLTLPKAPGHRPRKIKVLDAK